jgi:hypothetical protein
MITQLQLIRTKNVQHLMLVFHRFLWTYTPNPSTRGGSCCSSCATRKAGLQIRNAGATSPLLQLGAQQGVKFLVSNESKQSRNSSFSPHKVRFLGTTNPTFSELATKKIMRKITWKRLIPQVLNVSKMAESAGIDRETLPYFLPTYGFFIHFLPTNGFFIHFLPTMLHISTDLLC